MATVAFLHFCDHAFFDVNRQPCLISIYPLDLYVNEFPAFISSLTIAVGLRIPPGETARIYVEILDAKATPQRGWPMQVSGPPTDADFDGIMFLPFKTLSMGFAQPTVITARVREGEQVLAELPLRIVKATGPRRSPLGAPQSPKL